MSFAVTVKLTGVSSVPVKNSSFTATGASFTAVTVIVNVPVSVSVPSVTV